MFDCLVVNPQDGIQNSHYVRFAGHKFFVHHPENISMFAFSGVYIEHFNHPPLPPSLGKHLETPRRWGGGN